MIQFISTFDAVTKYHPDSRLGSDDKRCRPSKVAKGIYSKKEFKRVSHSLLHFFGYVYVCVCASTRLVLWKEGRYLFVPKVLDRADSICPGVVRFRSGIAWLSIPGSRNWTDLLGLSGWWAIRDREISSSCLFFLNLRLRMGLETVWYTIGQLLENRPEMWKMQQLLIFRLILYQYSDLYYIYNNYINIVRKIIQQTSTHFRARRFHFQILD